MRQNKISDKKQALIDQVLADRNFKVGDQVTVNEKNTNAYSPKDKIIWCTIKKIEGDIVYLTYSEYRNSELTAPISKVTKNTYTVGANPFVEQIRVDSYKIDIAGLAHRFELVEPRNNNPYLKNNVLVKEVNWNPYVFVDGEKQYYQRPFVWGEREKQMLVESIYNGIDCGRILVRNRSFQEIGALTASGETDVAFKDIVDGKQRLNAVRAFLNDEFADSQGNYYSDLSDDAQHKFQTSQCFHYAELPENTQDVTVIQQFLKVNFAGVPQSEEHINFVKELYKKF